MLKPLFSLLLVGLLFCQESHAQIDPKATLETKNLYANLKRLARTGTMFGHQDALAYGMGWKAQPGRSDVHDVAGEYPAVLGSDLGLLELDSLAELDGVPFANQRQYVAQAYTQGGVNTFSWHMRNPVDPTKSSWDKADSTISHLFSARKSLRRYRGWLARFARYAKSLKGSNGEAIPIIFRPFHEHTGNWFWWGKAHCTPAEYKHLWHYTVDYLRKKKKVHNLLYAYSTDNFTSREDYLERYPGDDYVDVIGFDTYHRPNAKDTVDLFVPKVRKMVEALRDMGREKDKLTAITEIGLEKIPITDWWTTVLKPIVQDAGLSYVLVWRNGRPDHYYAPYPNQVSAKNFGEFTKDPGILLEKRAKEANLYAAPPTR